MWSIKYTQGLIFIRVYLDDCLRYIMYTRGKSTNQMYGQITSDVRLWVSGRVRTNRGMSKAMVAVSTDHLVNLTEFLTSPRLAQTIRHPS